MDHKTLFTFHGHQTPNDCMELTLEEIYQAFKQRLIEELRDSEHLFLIDATVDREPT